MSSNTTTSTRISPANKNRYTIVSADDKNSKYTSDCTISTDGKTSQNVEPTNRYTTKQTFWDRVFSLRFLIVIILHISNAVFLSPLITMAMALVCMCGPVLSPGNETLQDTTNVSRESTYEAFTLFQNTTPPQGKHYEFSWDSKTRGLLLSSQMFGIFLVPLISNVVRGYIGNKLTLTLFGLTQGLLNFVAPTAARTSVYFLLVTRILTGLTINANIPVAGDTLAWWIPMQEKLSSVTIVVAGWIVGSATLPVISGFFCKIQVDNGWPLIFYFNGTLLMLWTTAWYFLTSRKPEKHRFISEKEKAYILSNRVGMNHDTSKAGDKPPYRSILTSRPVLAFILSDVCNLWAVMTVQTNLPTYLTSVLKFSVQEAGLLICVMFIIRFPTVYMLTAFGNYLHGQKSLTTNKVRKICSAIGQGLTSILFLATSFFDDRHKWIASVLFICATQFYTYGLTMTNVIPLDMAPRYAGFIAGMCASASFLGAMTSPIFVAAIAPRGLYEEWRLVLVVVAIIHTVGSLIFIIFGNAALQPWAVIKRDCEINCKQQEPSLPPKDRSDTASLDPHTL